jgi:predicted transcriptional regulator YdeE
MVKTDEIRLMRISLKSKTSNLNGQSAVDCGNLWQEFERGAFSGKIPGRLSNSVYAVYYAYEGDYMQPFSYFIGYPVKKDAQANPGIEMLTIPAGAYKKFTAEGVLPDCISNAWKNIWKSDNPRAYQFDFEVYDERSRNWNNAEVDIFVSVNQS